MTSRSDCEPLPKPTLSPFALARPGTFLRVGFSLPPCGVCLLCGYRWFILYKPLSQKKCKKNAQAWREPRSLTTRYATLLAGLTAQQRRARLARVAEAIVHPAIT